MRHIQGDQGFNTLGRLEVPEQAIEELLVNALIHRDYFTSASIRVMVFVDRIEIISPGHLPDSLSIETIRHGAANRRNPTLTEHAVHLLPYRGLGTGIPRALNTWPHITLINDVVGNQFKVVISRLKPKTEVTMQVTMEVTMEVEKVVRSLSRELTRIELQKNLDFKNADYFRKAYILPALESGLIEMTLPDKPRSSKQSYRRTTKGQQWLREHSEIDE
ncbi:MAG TPA: ATP-binding protein [Treponemataceae bacterium]|nr:ATP-binding protein [Treponemataceae bacterium]